MGGSQSSTVPGGGTDGYHVLKVSTRVIIFKRLSRFVSFGCDKSRFMFQCLNFKKKVWYSAA